MNKSGTILFFLLLTNFIYGQTGFFADGSRWVYHTGESSEPGQYFVHEYDEQDIIHGDTTIGGQNYFKLYKTFFRTKIVHTHSSDIYIHSYDSTGPTFLRYDTILNRIYHLQHVDSSEALIYDFNLEVGDTTPMQSENFQTTIIHSIDTVTIFGVSLKRFWVADISHDMTYFNNFILEGIGGSNGLTTYLPEYGWLGGGVYSTFLRCFEYMDSIYLFNDIECPFIDFISGVDPVSDELIVTIGPNPTNDVFTITITEELLNSTFSIVDCLGREVQSFKLTDLNSTSHLNSTGLYFWRVEHGGRLIRTGKVIRQ